MIKKKQIQNKTADTKLEMFEGLQDDIKKGKSILFIHGYHEGAYFFTETLMPAMYRLGVNTFAINLRGHGNSELKQDWENVSYNDYQTDVKTAIDYIIEKTGNKPIVIGHSMGGMLTQSYIEKNTLLGAVILSNGDPAKMDKFFAWSMKNFFWATIKMMMKKNPDILFKNENFLHSVMFSYKQPTGQSLKVVEQLKNQDDSPLVMENMQKIRFKGKKGSTPVLMIAGSKDPIAQKESLESNALIFGAQHYQIAGKRHDIVLIEAWKKTADIITMWLKDNQLIKFD